MIDTTKDFLELQEIIDAIVDEEEQNIDLEYKDRLEILRNTIGKMHDKYAVAGQLTFDELAKYDRINKLNQKIANEMQRLYQNNSNLIKGVLDDVYNESFLGTKDIIESAANRTIQGIVKEEVIEKAINQPINGLTLNQRLERYRNNIIIDIQETLGQGLQKGESYSEMSSRLKDSLEDDASKAHRIVRTESHRIMEESKLDSLDHAHNQGVNMKKYWLTSHDERVRGRGEGNHRKMGKKYSKDNAIPHKQDYVNDETGNKGSAPGLMGGVEDINCRCSSIPIISE